MASQLHVNGPCQIQVSTSPTGSLSSLGYTVDGVDPSVEDMTQEVFCDIFGPKVPFDEILLLQVAHISARVEFYDETVMKKMRSQIYAGTEGTAAGFLPGTLYGASGNYMRVNLSPSGGGTAGEPYYNFLYARITGARKVKLSVINTVYDLTWFAIPYTGSASGTPVLYNNSST